MSDQDEPNSLVCRASGVVTRQLQIPADMRLNAERINASFCIFPRFYAASVAQQFPFRTGTRARASCCRLRLYTTEDGRCQIKRRAENQTVWLTQRKMAQLFAVSTDNIGLHLKNIYEDGELTREATTE